LNRIGKTQTVTKVGLFVFFVLLVLLCVGTPILAQERDDVPKDESPTSVATPLSESPHPQPSGSIRKRPRTVGDVLTGKTQAELESAPEEAPEGQGDAVRATSSAGGQKLDLGPKKTPGKNWATGEVGESTFFDKLIRVCWALALVSLLVWVAAKLAGRAGLKQLGVGASPKSMIEVLERKRLSPGRSILLMRVGPKVLAVAATESGYETLTEFDEELFKKYQDARPGLVEQKAPDPPDGATTPADIARHYLSIIPGTGAKK
jgi:flagellar biogenesis protein FliO